MNEDSTKNKIAENKINGPLGTPSRQTLSVIYRTFNTDESFARSLTSIQWADEIIVIDRGSGDETVAIARHYTEQVFFHPSSDPYIQMQFALSKAQCDWVLFLEPQEWVEETLRQEIIEVLEYGKNQCEAYWLQRKLWMQGQGFWRCEPPTLRMVRRFKETLQDAGPWSAITVTGSSRPFKTPLMFTLPGGAEELFALEYQQGLHQACQALEAGKGKTNTLVVLWSLLHAFFYRYFILQGFRFGSTGFLMATAEAYGAFWTNLKGTLMQQKANLSP